MRAEYIEREAAIAEIEEWHDMYPDSDAAREALSLAKRAVRKIPAADVRPVVMGQNIYDTVKGHCEFKCSVCGVELSSVYGGRNDFGLDGGYFNFCPNCGADMRPQPPKEET